MKLLRSLLTLLLAALMTAPLTRAENGALDGQRHRVLVSSDIGGTDPDDFQSMAHLLLYSDVLDIEGLVSSPFGKGTKEHILAVIDCYEHDYPQLLRHSGRYPTPASLRALTKQGEKQSAPFDGFRRPTEGSEWIVACARRQDPRPLNVLVWGGIEDLAQALHDAPDILPRLRVHFIGGPNKKWSPDAYHYIRSHFPTLWIIESNSTYRGWFVGGRQDGDWGNKGFVTRHVAGHGALGNYFADKLGGVIKMGDTPSVAWLLRGTPDDPTKPGWGGRYVRAWARPFAHFERLTTKDDQLELFGILELVLPLGPAAPASPRLEMLVENQRLLGDPDGKGSIRFRYCPKEARLQHYSFEGNVPALASCSGEISVLPVPPDAALHPDLALPHWWADDPSPELAEGPHQGARSVSQWREQFLGDFALRLGRCLPPAVPDAR